MIHEELRTHVTDEFGLTLSDDEVQDVRLMVDELDEGSLVEFLEDRIDGGLTRDGCIAVSNLLADFGPDKQREE